jgi:large subunit ribosomal protein L14
MKSTTINSKSVCYLLNCSTSSPVQFVQLLTRLRCVDNSKIGKQAMLEGRPPKIIHIYSKKRNAGLLGDKVLVAVKGEKKKGILVGLRKSQDTFVPKFDSNNVVLIDSRDGNPIGTRILAPMPNCLRHRTNANMAKMFAISTKFV